MYPSRTMYVITTSCEISGLANLLSFDLTQRHFQQVCGEDDLTIEDFARFKQHALSDPGLFQLFGNVDQQQGPYVGFFCGPGCIQMTRATSRDLRICDDSVDEMAHV